MHSGRQDQVVSHESQTITQASKLRCFQVKGYKFYSDARKRMVTRQDTRLEFSFSLLLLHSVQISMNASIFFRLICETAVVAYVLGVNCHAAGQK